MPDDNEELTMLREHQRWLLTDAIPAYYEHGDQVSVDSCCEQLFDIMYQIELVAQVGRQERAARLQKFNADQRRGKQTYAPYD